MRRHWKLVKGGHVDLEVLLSVQLDGESGWVLLVVSKDPAVNGDLIWQNLNRLVGSGIWSHIYVLAVLWLNQRLQAIPEHFDILLRSPEPLCNLIYAHHRLCVVFLHLCA